MPIYDNILDESDTKYRDQINPLYTDYLDHIKAAYLKGNEHDIANAVHEARRVLGDDPMWIGSLMQLQYELPDIKAHREKYGPTDIKQRPAIQRPFVEGYPNTGWMKEHSLMAPPDREATPYQKLDNNPIDEGPDPRFLDEKSIRSILNSISLMGVS